MSALKTDQLEIGNWQSAMTWWTWHDLNVRPRPSQSRALIPLSYRSEVLAEGTGVEPASDKRAVVFGTTALPVRLPFRQHFRLPIGDCRLIVPSNTRGQSKIRNWQ